MDADLKQAILECLHDYYNIIYDGGSVPMWVAVMEDQYSADDGIEHPMDKHHHMENELVKYRNDLKRMN